MPIEFDFLTFDCVMNDLRDQEWSCQIQEPGIRQEEVSQKQNQQQASI
jgi:hypothetical protein